ncbi:MAG: Ig-like domain-containing protein, partial [Paramuribaculum sp.]|nr:Ig-like domain-containing protein [Paramuribaculum sp.]
TQVATVNANGTVSAVGKGTAFITASTEFQYNTFTQTCEVAVDFDAPTGVKISSQDNKLALGTELELKAQVLPAGALQQFTWSSSNEKIATISKEGIITPKTVGTVVFSAISDVNPDIYSSYTVNVYYAKPTSIDLEIVSDTLRIGDLANIKATVNPYPFAAQSVQWFSSDNKVATITQTGDIECLSVGKVIISAMSTNDKSIVGTKELNVDYSLPTDMSISTQNIDMKIGDVTRIQFTVEPAGAEQKADWVSADEEIAKVDSEGNITAVGIGETTITGIAGTVKASCSVTVDYADPVRVVLNYTGVNVNIGDSVQIVARVLPAGARQEIIWSVDNDSVATITQEGMVFGNVKGTTHIIARAAAKPTVFEGCNIIVLEPAYEQDPGYNAIEDITSSRFSTQIDCSSI